MFTSKWAQELTERDPEQAPAEKKRRISIIQPNGRFITMDKDTPKIKAYHLEMCIQNQLKEQNLPKNWAKQLAECVIKLLYMELFKIVGQVQAKEFIGVMMNALNIPFNG